jgi:hypothetical protein
MNSVINSLFDFFINLCALLFFTRIVMFYYIVGIRNNKSTASSMFGVSRILPFQAMLPIKFNPEKDNKKIIKISNIVLYSLFVALVLLFFIGFYGRSQHYLIVNLNVILVL